MGYALLAVLAFAAIVAALWPLLRQSSRAAPPQAAGDDLLELQERKAGLVRALQELEDDYRSGQIPEDEYRSLKEEYQRRAVQAMKELEKLPAIAPAPASSEPAPVGEPSRPRLSRTVALAVVVAMAVLAALGWWQLGPGRRDRALQEARAAEEQHRRALERVRAAVEQNPNDYVARSQLALLYYQIGERERSLSELDTVLAADPNFLLALYDRALIARAEQDFPTLIRYYRRFLEAAPQEREVPNKYPAGLIDQVIAAVQDDMNQLRQMLAASGAGSPSSEAPAATEAADGQLLYAQYCAGCHGANAQGGLGGLALRNNQFIIGAGPEATERVIRNGRGSMPAWGTLLNDQQISALVDYLVSLNR